MQIGRKAHHKTLHSPQWSLVTELAIFAFWRQVNMADSLWMKFSFIRKSSLQVQDIWKDGKFSNWLLSPLDQKSFQELVFKAFKNRKRSGCVDLAGQIDCRNFVFFRLTYSFLKDDDNCEWSQYRKTKTSDEFIFRSFTAKLDEMSKRVNWFTINVRVSLLLKLQLHMWMHTNNYVCVFVLAVIL